MKKVLIFFLGLLFLPLTLAPSSGQTIFNEAEKIAAFDTAITINTDATADIIETIRYDFGSLQRHGIYRTIPITKKRADGKTVLFDYTVISVTDENEKSYRYTISKNASDITIKIGSADQLITGQHTYRIHYIVRGAMGYFDDHDELYWNATGNEWKVPIQQARAVTTLADDITLAHQDTVCYTGPVGSINTQCARTSAGNTASFETETTLLPGEGLTIAVKFPKNIIAYVAPKIKNELPEQLKQILLGALMFLWYVVYPLSLPIRWYLYGRDPFVGAPLTAWYDPPKTTAGRFLTPAETGTLVDETADIKDITATIVHLGQKGYLTIKEKNKKHFSLIKTNKNTTDPALAPFEKTLLEGLFADGTEAHLSDGSFISLTGEVKQSLYQAVVNEGFFPKNPGSVRTFYVLIVVIAVMTANIPLVICALIFGKNMVKKTPAGARAAQIALSLKNFLSSQSRQLAYQAKNQLFFEKLLPYAIAFGVEKIWARRFADVAMTQPSWYEGDFSPLGFNSLVFIASLNSSLHQFQKSATPVPSRSGSGFGGGFSDGGGGGGGGGSW